MQEKNSKICSFCLQMKSVIVSSSDENSFICPDCVHRCNRIFEENHLENSTADSKFKLYSPKKLKEKLDEYIIGQEEAKKVLCVGVYNHFKRIMNPPLSDEIELEKANILVVGPTGSGKTLLASTMAKILNIPFVIADATTLTEAGYVGDDVENILLKLLHNSRFDVKKAEKGIIFIDEIDKISRKSQSTSITRDVSGEGVQQALLKIIEGTESNIPSQGGRKHPQGNNIKLNTKNILFICGGAFIGLEDIIKERLSSSSMGFVSSREKKITNNNYIFKYSSTNDFVKFGIIPELIGRLPIQTNLYELTDEELESILLKSKNSILKQYQYLLKLEGVELSFSKEAVQEIIQLSKEFNTGARGLRSIVEKLMLDIMYNITGSKAKKIVIGKKELSLLKKEVDEMKKNIA